MGADMILSVVAIPKNTKINWEAGDEFVLKLDLTNEEVLSNLVEYGNLDEEEFFADNGSPYVPKIRDWLSAALAEFQACLDSREVCSIQVRDLWLYVTGGMSWGDDTDAGYVFSKVGAVPGLLNSMGFVEDYWDVDKTVTPEEEAAAIDSIAKAKP